MPFRRRPISRFVAHSKNIDTDDIHKAQSTSAEAKGDEKPTAIRQPLSPTYLNSRTGWFIALTCLFSFTSTVFNMDTHRPRNQDQITFNEISWQAQDFLRQGLNQRPDLSRHYDRKTPDYGGLNLQHTIGLPVPLMPQAQDDELYRRQRRQMLANMDEDVFPAEDKDIIETPKTKCRRPNWVDEPIWNCNDLHEYELGRLGEDNSDSKLTFQFLGQGSYRGAWLVSDIEQNDVVWKLQRLDNKMVYDHYSFEQAHYDALIMERLTSSNRIPDIYGHCGTSLIMERLGEKVLVDMIGGKEWWPEERTIKKAPARDKELIPDNNLTLAEKLDMAIAFTEALAEMHGYPGGTMLHGDFHFPQWFYSTTGQIKLNGFNRGMVLKFNEKKVQYCPIIRCSKGSYRSPEINRCNMRVNEASDIFSLGNNFYVLMTGFRPHYEWTGSQGELYDKIGSGERLPYIDERYRHRSDIESTFVKLMEACWKFKAEDRISAFDILKELYALKGREQRRASNGTN